jgi:hypothetical protein
MIEESDFPETPVNSTRLYEVTEEDKSFHVYCW